MASVLTDYRIQILSLSLSFLLLSLIVHLSAILFTFVEFIFNFLYIMEQEPSLSNVLHYLRLANCERLRLSW